MKIKKNTGAIGVDVGVAIIVFIMFTGIITTLLYNSAMSAIGTERKGMATDIAVKVIENIKVMDYSEFLDKFSNNTLTEGVEMVQGYNVTISVSDEKSPDLLREITVAVKYMFKDKEENVEIKTLKSYI